MLNTLFRGNHVQQVQEKKVRWPRGAEITVDLFYTLKMKSTLPVVGLLVRRGRVLFCSCASNKHYLYGD